MDNELVKVVITQKEYKELLKLKTQAEMLESVLTKDLRATPYGFTYTTGAEFDFVVSEMLPGLAEKKEELLEKGGKADART